MSDELKPQASVDSEVFRNLLTIYRDADSSQSRAARAALIAHIDAWRIPAGWKLVPIEPNEYMVTQGFESWPDEFFSKPEEWAAYKAMTGCQKVAHLAKLCWSAMIDAAPSREDV